MKALIIGLGRIGWLFDKNSDSPDSKTHFKALKSIPNVEIFGVDPSQNAREDFSFSTGCQAFASLEDFKQQISTVDIISICSPNSHHYKDFMDCLSLNPRYVWLEKPAGSNIQDIAEMNQLALKHGIKVLVNYPRRFQEQFQKLKKLVDSTSLGKLTDVEITYSRLLRINGCHYIDLLSWLLGRSAFSIQYSDKKPNPSAILDMGSVKVVLNGMDVDYHNLDIKLTFENGRASILHGGNLLIEEERVTNELFPEFSMLKLAKITEYPIAGNNFNQILENFISQNHQIGSTLEDAIYIEKVISAIESP
jgi:predicted dehydrogenase